MSHHARIVGSLCLAIALGAAPTAAQSPIAGTVVGTVTLDGEPLEGALVALKAVNSEKKCETKTDTEGKYSCHLTIGPYELSVTIEGNLAYTRQVEVRGGVRGDLDNLAFSNRFDVPLVTSPERQRQEEEARKRQEELKQLKANFNTAQELNDAGKYTEALPILQGLAKTDSAQWAVFAELARAYSHLNRLQEAEASYKQAIELDPTNASLHTNLGSAYAKMERVEEAQREFEIAAELDPANAGAAFFNLGLLLHKSNQLTAAIEPLRKATEIDPNRALAFYLLGLCLYNNAEVKMDGGEIKTILLPGTRESFERYLALEPKGRFADDARAMLQAIDATVLQRVRPQQ